MSYLPASKSGNWNAPSAPVTVSRVAFVPAFLTTTVAPGSTPPPESVTVPEIWPVNPCACTELIVPPTATSSATTKTILQRRDITLHSSRRSTKCADFIHLGEPHSAGCPLTFADSPHKSGRCERLRLRRKPVKWTYEKVGLFGVTNVQRCATTFSCNRLHRAASADDR